MIARDSANYLPELAGTDPEELLAELDRFDCKDSLRAYTRLAWSVLEPDRGFVPGWHLDAIADHLTAVSNGEILRLLINIPPGCMKSLSTNVLWPTWEWGPLGKPGLRYVSAAYSQDLTIRDNRRARSLLQSPWYRRRWPHVKLVSDQNAKTRFDTDQMGFRIATSVGGLGVGERGDRFVIDDPHNIKDGESNAKRNEVLLWLDEVVPTRLSDPAKSAIILIMQRVHEQDAAGHLLEKELGYVHLMLPMEFDPKRRCSTSLGFVDPRREENELLWPSRMTREVVDRDKKAMGEYAAAAQFDQNPTPRGGGMFKRLWWKFYRSENGSTFRPEGCNELPALARPQRKEFDWIGMSIDAAFKKNEKTGSRVGFLVAGGIGALIYTLADFTQFMGFTETVRLTREMHKEFEPQFTLIEKKANGDAVLDTLGPEIPGIIGVEPEGGKDSRAAASAFQCEAGQLLLPEGEIWTSDFVTEHAQFPSSAKDDRVDAMSQLCIYVNANPHLAKARQLIRF